MRGLWKFELASKPRVGTYCPSPCFICLSKPCRLKSYQIFQTAFLSFFRKDTTVQKLGINSDSSTHRAVASLHDLAVITKKQQIVANADITPSARTFSGNRINNDAGRLKTKQCSDGLLISNLTQICPSQSAAFGKPPKPAYNRPFLSGGDLGFDGGCEADAGIPGSQSPVKHWI